MTGNTTVAPPEIGLFVEPVDQRPVVFVVSPRVAYEKHSIFKFWQGFFPSEVAHILGSTTMYIGLFCLSPCIFENKTPIYGVGVVPATNAQQIQESS